jgi:hypothetical protein
MGYKSRAATIYSILVLLLLLLRCSLLCRFAFVDLLL